MSSAVVNGDDDAGVPGVPATVGSAEDARARDGDAETTGATEAGAADACNAVQLPSGTSAISLKCTNFS